MLSPFPKIHRHHYHSYRSVQYSLHSIM